MNKSKNQEDLLCTIKERKINHIGHIMRGESNKWQKKLWGEMSRPMIEVVDLKFEVIERYNFLISFRRIVQEYSRQVDLRIGDCV